MDAVRAKVGGLATLALAVVVASVVGFAPRTTTSKPVDFVAVLERAEFARKLAEAEANARLAERDVGWVDRRGCSYFREEAKKALAQLEEIKRRQRELTEKVRIERERLEWSPRRQPRLTKDEIELCTQNPLCKELRR